MSSKLDKKSDKKSDMKSDTPSVELTSLDSVSESEQPKVYDSVTSSVTPDQVIESVDLTDPSTFIKTSSGSTNQNTTSGTGQTDVSSNKSSSNSSKSSSSKLSIIILLAAVLFQLVTLPVEIDASKRALVQLEELNLVYNDENKSADDHLKAYSEEYHLGMWVTGNNFSDSWSNGTQKSSFFELKAYVQNIFVRLGFDFRTLKTEEYTEDFFSEALKIRSGNGTLLATYGIVSPDIRKITDVDAEVFYADLRWNNILKELNISSVKYTELPKFPVVRRDLAFLLDKNIPFAEIEKIAFETERKLLKKVCLFDVYEGKNLEVGKKSYAVSFMLQDESKTMTDNVIDGIMRKIQQNIETKLKAKLRG